MPLPACPALLREDGRHVKEPGYRSESVIGREYGDVGACRDHRPLRGDEDPREAHGELNTIGSD